MLLGWIRHDRVVVKDYLGRQEWRFAGPFSIAIFHNLQGFVERLDART